MVGHRFKVKRPPLNSAEFNMREISKQMLLLEDHLSDDEKFCMDCIRKHLLMVEGLSEESVTLEPDGDWVKSSRKLANMAREWMVAVSEGVDRIVLAKEMRTERKKLVALVYDPRVGY